MFSALTLSLPLVLALSGLAGRDVGQDAARDAGWRSDVEFLVAEAQRVHAGPERPAFSARFLAAADELRAAVPDLTDDEMVARLMRLTAFLGDGHSALYGPGPDSPLDFEDRTLPLRFHLFPSGLHVIDGAGDLVELAGSRVVRFGELAADVVLQRMSAYRGVDNGMTWRWLGPQFYVPQLALLREVGAAADDSASIEIALVTPEGEKRSLTVAAGSHRFPRKLRPFPLRDREPPLYLSRVDTNYWTTSFPEKDAIYFQFNQVRDAPGETIAAFAERLRSELKAAEPTALIVDVRHNNGGNNTLVRPLVRALIEFEMRAPGNRIFVLTGRNTFSACQNFITRVERWTDAVFVGEPSSSSPNFVGEENELVLPFSRVRGSLSNRYWQDSDPWDDRPWIAPDLPVQLTARDYLEGHDPVLERVLEELRRPETR